jgi:hypothetical protein
VINAIQEIFIELIIISMIEMMKNVFFIYDISGKKLSTVVIEARRKNIAIVLK